MMRAGERQGLFFELRITLFEESGDAFAGVIAREQHGEGADLCGASVGEADFCAVQHGFFCGGDGDMAACEDLLGGCKASIEECVRFGDLVDESEAKGFFGGDGFTCIDEFAGHALGDLAHQALGSAKAGHEAEFDFGESKAGFVGGINEVTSERKFGSTAKSDAIDGSDHRLWHGFESHKDAVSDACEGVSVSGVKVLHGLDIGTCDKGPISCAGQDHHTDAVVHHGVVEGLVEFDQDVFVECVEGLGAIEGDDAGAIAIFDQEMLKSRHGKAPWIGRLGRRDALKESLEMSVHAFGGVAFAAADRLECLDCFAEIVVFDDVIKLGGSGELGAGGLESPLDLVFGFCAASDKALNHRVPRGRQQEDQGGLVSKEFADLSCALDVDIEQDVVALAENFFGGAAACSVIVVVNVGPFEKSFALNHLFEGVFGDKVIVNAVLFVVSGGAGGVGDGECVAG